MVCPYGETTHLRDDNPILDGTRATAYLMQAPGPS
jgi:hypothetical protein